MLFIALIIDFYVLAEMQDRYQSSKMEDSEKSSFIIS